jgi:hypothetical protein
MNRITPLAIEILLHYNACPGDYRDGDFSAPAVEELMTWFVSEGLLIPLSPRGSRYGGSYQIAPRGRALVEGWCSVPLPENEWRIPWETLK